MNKSLGLLAGLCLVLALVFFALAGVLAPNGFRGLGAELDLPGEPRQASGPGRVQWAWDGSDTFRIGLPAKVTLTAGGPPQLIVRGDQDILQHVTFRNGRLSGGGDILNCALVIFCGNGGRHQMVEVELRGAHPKEIDISGVAEVELGQVEQDSLTLRISGAGEIEGEGHVNNLDLSITGAGQASLAKLAVGHARVRLSGAGEAEIAPSESADVNISGMGDVNLVTKPKSLTSHVSGMGSLDGPGAEAADDGGKRDRDRDRQFKQDRKISDKVQKAVQKALENANIQDNVQRSVKRALDNNNLPRN